MTEAHAYRRALLGNLSKIRLKAGLSEAALEERLILGPGWIRNFESGETVPSIDMVLAILHETGATLQDLLQGLPDPQPAAIERAIFAEQIHDGLTVHFRYAAHDAKYHLAKASLAEYEAVIKTLRNGLAKLAAAEQRQTEAIKTNAVADAFLESARRWPEANPSDLWWFLVYRAYCDPYNHPASFARLDLSQSWKRTAGWALEEILVRHYKSFLKTKRINIFIPDSAEKQHWIGALQLSDRIETDKIDVILTGDTGGGQNFFGVVHVKASFAERRTDDVPLSQVLVNAGYTSPLWTMDCKSTPASEPANRGELGDVDGRRSAKRKDIENEGYFTGCFSYNVNTQPSPPALPAERRIYVCNFNNPDDEFSSFIVKRWRAHHST